MSGEQASVTGVWNGLFTYPDGVDPGHFVATLLEFGGSLSGTTHEPNLWNADITLFATLNGSRVEDSVRFVKTYDGSGGWSHAVDYEGRLSGDRSEIEGVWTIPGQWSGRFLMIRAGRAVTAERREAFAKA